MQSFRTELENPIIPQEIIDLERKIKAFRDGKIHDEIKSELGCSMSTVETYSNKIRRENPKIKLIKKRDVYLTPLQKEIIPYLVY